ncbi:MAG TPA: hypothetical protein VGN79_12355 [Devosia sp.]|jgi:hypothetical protein|nr:hypothetical protein [Devosia sp.]
MPDPEFYAIKDANGVVQTFTPNDDPPKGAKQDATVAAIQGVGTRAYGAATRIAAAAVTTVSAPIAAGEVMLHASVKQYVLVVDGEADVITADAAIPLEAGEKFHLRITSGQRIATIRDSEDGFLHIVAVA